MLILPNFNSSSQKARTSAEEIELRICPYLYVQHGYNSIDHSNIQLIFKIENLGDISKMHDRLRYHPLFPVSRRWSQNKAIFIINHSSQFLTTATIFDEHSCTTSKSKTVKLIIFDLILPVTACCCSLFFLISLTNFGTINFKAVISPPAIPNNVVKM
jgi:hypothetical protein